MAAGFGLLGLSPTALWSMTPREFAAALRGRLGPQPVGPPTRDEVAALMHRFPDA
jgi:uncharacterized phage protein (TIGR02216 family)